MTIKTIDKLPCTRDCNAIYKLQDIYQWSSTVNTIMSDLKAVINLKLSFTFPRFQIYGNTGITDFLNTVCWMMMMFLAGVVLEAREVCTMTCLWCYFGRPRWGGVQACITTFLPPPSVKHLHETRTHNTYANVRTWAIGYKVFPSGPWVSCRTDCLIFAWKVPWWGWALLRELYSQTVIVEEGFQLVK